MSGPGRQGSWACNTSTRVSRDARGASHSAKAARKDDKGTNDPLATRLLSLFRTFASVSTTSTSYSSLRIWLSVAQRAET